MKEPSLIKPERSEPSAAPVAIPVMFFMLLLLFFYWGTLYLDKHGGGFSKDVYAPYGSSAQLAAMQPKSEGGELMARGKQVYGNACAPCHQASGMGAAGQFPPLAGSEWVTQMPAGRAIRIVLNGMQGPVKVKGAEYNNAMVPWRDSLNDQDIAAVVSYIRNEWGNKADNVTPEQVKKIREETASRTTAWTAEELMQVE